MRILFDKDELKSFTFDGGISNKLSEAQQLARPILGICFL